MRRPCKASLLRSVALGGAGADPRHGRRRGRRARRDCRADGRPPRSVGAEPRRIRRGHGDVVVAEVDGPCRDDRPPVEPPDADGARRADATAARNGGFVPFSTIVPGPLPTSGHARYACTYVIGPARACARVGEGVVIVVALVLCDPRPRRRVAFGASRMHASGHHATRASCAGHRERWTSPPRIPIARVTVARPADQAHDPGDRAVTVVQRLGGGHRGDLRSGNPSSSPTHRREGPRNARFRRAHRRAPPSRVPERGSDSGHAVAGIRIRPLRRTGRQDGARVTGRDRVALARLSRRCGGLQGRKVGPLHPPCAKTLMKDG